MDKCKLDGQLLHYGKPECFGSGGSLVAKLKLKGIDGKLKAGVLRRAQGGQKPPVEQKGKSSLDLDFQYEYRP